MRIAVIALLFCFGVSRPLMAADPALSKQFRIVTSFYPVYIMAKNVAGGVPGVTVDNLTPSSVGCLHDYSLTAQEVKRLSDADIFITNGAGMESFLDHVAGQYPKLKILPVVQDIPLLGGEKGRINPHVWVSVSAMVRLVDNLAEGLGKADPVRKDWYERNARAYKQKLFELRDLMHASLDEFSGRRIVTFHEAFPYFAKEFGLVVTAVIEHEPGTSPSAGELAKTISVIRNAGVKVLFTEPQYPPGVAETIAQETGARIFQLDPAVTGPDDPDAYIEIMKKNLEVLKTALQ